MKNIRDDFFRNIVVDYQNVAYQIFGGLLKKITMVRLV